MIQALMQFTNSYERFCHFNVQPRLGKGGVPLVVCNSNLQFVALVYGVLTPLYDRAIEENWPVEIVHIDNPACWLPNTSSSFHGRDIFAPVAAHLATGVPLGKVGTPIVDPVRIAIPKPVAIDGGFQGEVIHIDHFGNLGTNIRADMFEAGIPRDRFLIKIAGQKIEGMSRTFGDKESGSLLAHFDSNGYIGISVAHGNASETLLAGVGTKVQIITR
ncbi:MAG: SAM-dependent chlorinase/fluorinase [Phycisphaerae bacterium]|nr:SAM-dependent chlorinase/fluorinase [Phycisphaerae bacterium]